jgi:hypothetical protein
VKLGTENKFELWTAILLGVIAVVCIGYWLIPSSEPAKASPAPAPNVAANRALINPLDPTLRLDLLESSQNVRYEGKGRNIFRKGAADVKIPGPIVPPLPKPNPGPIVPPGPPPPPPIDLKFFGSANRPGEQPRIFLSEGENVFLAHEGDIVNSRYKIVKINPQSVEIEDLLNNNRQSIPLSQG